MLAFTDLVSDLTGMGPGGTAGTGISGVLRVYTAPPESVDSADLPALFPMIPAGDQEPLTFGTVEYGGSRTLELWAPVKPSGQGTLAEAYSALTTLMDALDAALRELDKTVAYRMTWSMRAATLTVAGQEYRGIVLTVTAQEE